MIQISNPPNPHTVHSGSKMYQKKSQPTPIVAASDSKNKHIPIFLLTFLYVMKPSCLKPRFTVFIGDHLHPYFGCCKEPLKSKLFKLLHASIHENPQLFHCQTHFFSVAISRS